MSEIATPPVTEQAKPEEKSGLALLSDHAWFKDDFPAQKETAPVETAEQIKAKEDAAAAEAALKTPIVEPTAEEKAAAETRTNELKELKLPETATAEEIAAAKVAQKPADEWTIDNAEKIKADAESNGWRELAEKRAEKFGFEVPTDLEDSEEAFYKWDEEQTQKKIESSQKFDKEVYLATLTPDARLAIELMTATGQTIEQINAPYVEIQQAKAMTDEQLVRQRLEAKYKDQELVDRKLQEIIADDALAIEGKIIRTDIDNYEKQITAQRTQQLEQYKAQQNQVKEQARNKEYAAIKHELGRVTSYMERKLGDDVKTAIYNELTSGKYDNMPGTPQEKVDYALYRKLGQQGVKYIQDRVREQLTLEFAKKQHNVPIVTEGAGNRHIVDSDKKGIDRLEDDPRFKG